MASPELSDSLEQKKQGTADGYSPVDKHELTEGQTSPNEVIGPTWTKNEFQEQEARALMRKGESHDGLQLQQKLKFLETCIQCGKRDSDQRTLKCDHSFCTNCLLEQCDSNNGSSTIYCFYCKEITEIPHGGVKELPQNIRVIMFARIIDRLVLQNNDPKNFTCELCKNGDTVCYCRNCDTNMCGACRRKHAERSLFAEHDVLDIEELKGKLLRKPVAKCEEHNLEVMYMCTKTGCFMLLCPVCVQFDLCGHEDKVNEIKKLLKGFGSTFQEESNQLKENIKALEEYHNSVLESQKEIEKTKEEIERHHRKVMDKLRRKIEEKRKTLINQVEEAEMENKLWQTDVENEWEQIKQRTNQVEQWQQQMNDQDNILSAIVRSQLQFHIQSMRGHTDSVREHFDKRKPIKVNFEPKDGEPLGDVNVEGASLKPTHREEMVEFIPNTVLEMADQETEDEREKGNLLRHSTDQIPEEAKLLSTAGNLRNQRIKKKGKKTYENFTEANISITGLMDKYVQVNISVKPLHEPIELFEPKKITKAVFLDSSRVAVSDSDMNIINIYDVTERRKVFSKRFKETAGFAALSMFNNKLLAVDDNLQIFVIHPEKLKYYIEPLQNTKECTKVGDITTTADDKIIISQISPSPMILCLNKNFKMIAVWPMTSGTVPRFICSNEQDQVIIVDTGNAGIDFYDYNVSSDYFVSNRHIGQLIEPRWVCNIDSVIYIIHHDPTSCDDWVLNLNKHVELIWDSKKIKNYGKAITTAASKEFFLILAERAMEVYSREDMVIEDDNSNE